jgi:hypothetical protein
MRNNIYMYMEWEFMHRFIIYLEFYFILYDFQINKNCSSYGYGAKHLSRDSSRVFFISF